MNAISQRRANPELCGNGIFTHTLPLADVARAFDIASNYKDKTVLSVRGCNTELHSSKQNRARRSSRRDWKAEEQNSDKTIFVQVWDMFHSMTSTL
eukprot:5528256-Amphidinium_carterae.1